MRNVIVAFCLIVVFSLDSQAQNWWKNGIKGEGPIVKKQLDLRSFDAIRLTNSAKVYLKQGPQSVEIEGQENIIENLMTEVDDQVWKIRFDRPVRKHEGLTIYISIPDLRGVRISGSGDVIGDGQFTGLDKLGISVSGSGNINMDVQARDVDTHISGSGDIRLAGTTNGIEVHISGSGDIEAYNLKSESCDIHISGSGDCEVDVSENLEVKITGSGDVSYKGRPRVSSKISGSGDIRGRS